MTELPPALEQAFAMAAGELGMCSASRLFVRELADLGGTALVAAARERLGRMFPVFDFVAECAERGQPPAAVDARPVARVLGGTTRLLVVGLEADFLDALVPAVPELQLGLVTEAGGFEADFRRVLANFGGRVEGVALSDLPRWAGRRSALLTFVYGSDGHVAHVGATWLRVTGPDVRTQFRALVGWDVLGAAPLVYPRWLVETSRDELSHLVSAEPPAKRGEVPRGASGP